MSLKIITKRCKGCGICAAFCPKKVLAVSLVAAKSAKSKPLLKKIASNADNVKCVAPTMLSL